MGKDYFCDDCQKLVELVFRIGDYGICNRCMEKRVTPRVNKKKNSL